MRCLIDTDALLKITACRLLNDWCDQAVRGDPVWVLPTAKFQVGKSKAIARRYPAEVVRAALEFTLSRGMPDRLVAAGEQEQLTRPGIDAGEAMLLAALIIDADLYLISGDKRALCALAEAEDLSAVRESVRGRIVCLEQVVLAFVRLGKFYAIREAMLRAASVDEVFGIVFSQGIQTTQEAAEAGLVSYVDDLQRVSGSILMLQAEVEKLLAAV